MRPATEQTIRAWLDGVPDAGTASDEKVLTLSYFLQGFELVIASDEEPCIVLYDCAVACRSVAPLTTGVAGVLDKWLAGKWKPSLREQDQYNLLQLCADIGNPRRLGDRIWELYRRELVTGDYQSLRPIPLTRVLLAAMIRNQVDGLEALALWQKLLNGDSDAYVGGTPLDGFTGMLYFGGDDSPEDRNKRLAGCLLTIHNQPEENLFFSALAALRRARPAAVEGVLRLARVEIYKEFERVVANRGSEAIERTLQWFPRYPKDHLDSEWEKFTRDLLRVFREQLEETRKLPTLMELESLYSQMLTAAFYRRKEEPIRRLLLWGRKLAKLREPEEVKESREEVLMAVAG